MNAGGAILIEGIERGMVEVCMDTPDRDELTYLNGTSGVEPDSLGQKDNFPDCLNHPALILEKRRTG